MKRYQSRPRIHINDSDGRATLHGLHYHDLRALLTAAQLYRYDQKKREAGKTETPENAAYVEAQIKLGDLLDIRLKEAIAATHPARDGLTVAQRREAVLAARSFRHLVDELVDEICASRAPSGAPAQKGTST